MGFNATFNISGDIVADSFSVMEESSEMPEETNDMQGVTVPTPPLAVKLPGGEPMRFVYGACYHWATVAGYY